jgi:hypothetical protein
LKKIGEIMNYGVMMTPALAIDGIVRASGQIPPGAEIVAWIAAAAGVPATAPGGSRGATALPPRPAGCHRRGRHHSSRSSTFR